VIRATLDTPILIAGLSSRGASYAILQGLEHFEAAVSVALLLEYEAVLTRPEILSKLPGWSVPSVVQFLTSFATVAYQAHPIYYQQKPVLTDPDDERVLECVVASQSQYLVTMNLRHFVKAAKRFNFTLATPPQFLEILRRTS
jgi:predicted nucleic acid-binding protein